MKNNIQVIEKKAQVGGKELSISTGEFAKQADGSIMVQLGETIVLGTATMSNPFSPDADFMPLLVDYEEKFYAAGKIKGSRFMKREGRPNDEAILSARIIDRAIRPRFPKGMINDIQVVLTILSYDGENDPDILAMIAACGAIMLSGIPWEGPMAATRVGMIDDNFITNPTAEEQKKSTVDLVLAGTGDNITMLEGGAKEIPENILLDAMEHGQKAMAEVTPILEELKKEAGKEEKEIIYMKENKENTEHVQEIAREVFEEKLEKAVTKEEIGQAERDTVAHVMAKLSYEAMEEISEREIRSAVHNLHADHARDRILGGQARSDGRALDEIRPLYTRAGILPRTHGSGVFQRGNTQVLTTVTLGGPDDELIMDTMESEEKRRYITYYNIPAFSVGEVRPNRGPGRRDIGHGALAERALLPVLPEKENWPYTMLLVSEVLESHGSSSMASVCGSSLALMDAGVPISKAVAGIAMGLMSDDEGNHKILTDIAGMEDEKGDMDFKVAGTQDGVTAMQMDIKVTGLTREVLAEVLEQAKRARLHILEAMNEAITEPRAELSQYAPRIHTMRIPVDKIGELIGPKGKNINEIIEETGVEMNIDDDGIVSITTNDAEGMEKAIERVKNLTREIKAGERFEGKVVKIMDFGAFVEIIPNVDGLVHISQFRDERVDKVEDVVKVGDIISVIVSEVDSTGKISLSHKDAVNSTEKESDRPKPETRPSTDNGPFEGPRPPQV